METSWIAEKRWRDRISRARELRQQHPAAEAALRLYEATLKFQTDVAVGSKTLVQPEISLREQINFSSATSAMAGILSLAIEYGPDALAVEARRLEHAGPESWVKLLESAVSADPSARSGAEDFFGRACLQPLAENLQTQLPKVANSIQATCPLCGGLPQMAVLRPEGEGASRFLLCSFCLGEWLYRRIACPWCGEEDKEKLPRYSAEECAHVHVEACDTCKRYLKAVDMTMDGLAVPLVDEAALAALDVWADDHGYAKVIRNLLGF